ncbi:hypothetical protein Tco_0882113 [Tanacetum coccineum]
MKSSFSSHRVLVTAYFCFLVALLQVEGIRPIDNPEVNHNSNGQPYRNFISCLCSRCRLLYKNLASPPPPPIMLEETDKRFGTEKRLVPGGPNPLHN